MKPIKKDATTLGPALSIAQVTEGHRTKPTEICTKRHWWVVSKYSRQCSECGIVEEKDALGRYIPHPLSGNLPEPIPGVTKKKKKYSRRKPGWADADGT